MSLMTTTAHGIVFGFDLMDWPDEAGRETAAASLTVQLHELGADRARGLHETLSRTGWHRRPGLVRRIEGLARARGLSVYRGPVRAACSVAVFPADVNELPALVTLH